MTTTPHKELSGGGYRQQRMTVALGTFVSIDARYASAGAPNPLDAAMPVLDVIEARMHPTRTGSDLVAIGEAAVGEPVNVHPWTFEVLTLARRVWESSRGVFDPCLPEQPGRLSDLELLPADTARRLGPQLRIDLGGIAKGFAIDHIVDALQANGCLSGQVNAGGDVRVFGPDEWPIDIHVGGTPRRSVTLRNEALAVSEPKSASSPAEHRGYYSRLTGRAVEGHPVAVCAGSAAVADALTKCAILSEAADMRRLLTEYDARSVTL